jgi:protein arginine N-methyltransferase 1
MAQGTGYNLFAYGGMIGPSSKVRVEAYVAALRQAITPCENVVLEIGTGAGFFALLAAKFGARHVYAIDPNGAINIARELAAANGMSERITFIRKMSTNVTLPERADVMVSDIRGALPWLGEHIPSIMDARERLLAAGAVQIPQQDTVWVAVVEVPRLYAPYRAPWDGNQYGLDLRAARRRVTNHHRKGAVKPEQLLVEPQVWATLDYQTITSPHAKAKVSWTIDKAGTGHGLSMWFDTVLLDKIGFSNAPTAPPIPIYSQLFFPWSKPVRLSAGDVVTVTLTAHKVEARYVWSWHSTISDSKESVKARFKQSSFLSDGKVQPQ